ncbi:hypothetical protein [Ekhidna sp.]
MNRFCVLAFFGILTFSCSQQTPKIDYENQIDTVATILNIVEDTTKILVSELPVRFDSTEVLIYAVRLVNLQERGGYSKFGSGSYSSSNISSSYFNKDNLSGQFINLVFEDETGNRTPLTNHKMTINRVLFLRGIYNHTEQQYLMYTLYDRDTNGDGRINRRDLESLYLSDIDGKNFKKISKELHEFYDHRTLKNDNKLYFRTLEDINKDGKLNNQDKFHYYKIEFQEDGFKIDEYSPIDAFSQ